MNGIPDPRREQMLERLLADMRVHHRRRRGARRALGVLTLALATGIGWRLAATVPGTGPVPEAAPAASMQIVRGTPRSGLIRTIGDDELLARLAEIRRPAGLIREGGRVRLTDLATDPQPEAPPSSL